MKNRKLIFATIALFFLISLSIPSWLWIRDYGISHGGRIDSLKLSEFAIFQSFIIEIWGLILNLILVIIAYKAFRNFGVKKQFHNKQLDVVSELTKSITSTVLSVRFYTRLYDPKQHEYSNQLVYTLSFFEIAFAFDYDGVDLLCIKSNNIENVLPFIKFRNHPFLPKKISVKLDKLHKPVERRNSLKKEDLPKVHATLFTGRIYKNDFSEGNIYAFYYNPVDFKKDCKEIKQEITNWFNEYGASDINF